MVSDARPDRLTLPLCEPPESGKYCGMLPLGHSEIACHNESERKRRVILELKKLLKKLDKIPQCEEWDTLPSGNTTRGPFRFGVYEQGGKPWSTVRVKSQELVGGHMVKSCDCLKRNGLQDECRRTQCRGRPLCMQQPFPACPPFTRVPKQVVDPDPWKECKHKPWEKYQHP